MVHLIEDYYLTADKYQYIVGRMKERRRGERKTRELMETTYHPTLAAAVSHVADELLRKQIEDGRLETLKRIVDEYRLIAAALIDQLDAAPRELRRKVNDCDE